MTTSRETTPTTTTGTRVVDHRSEGFRNHVLWGMLGIGSAAALWYAGTVPGAIGLFVAIGLAFPMWYRLGSRGSWMAVLLIGVIISSLTGWQAVTSARCPGAGDELYMQAGKRGVNCNQLRASAASMSVLFGFFAILAALAPFSARKARAAERAAAEAADADGLDATA
jgi:hypothetical protein